MKSRVFFYFLILFPISLGLTAQNPYIRHYTTNDGLLSNSIYYVFQDSKKFIWFATDVGVVRFDGTTFTNFRKKDGLTSNEIIRIKEDLFGRIWFFNLNGRLDYFFRNKIFSETQYPALKAIKNKTFFTDFFQDSDSVIYFYNRRSEIFALSPQGLVKQIDIAAEIVKDQPKSIHGELSLKFLHKNHQDEFILWTSHGIFRMNRFFKKPVNLLDSAEISMVFPDHDKFLCVFSDQDNVIRFNENIQAESGSIPFRKELGFGGIRSIMEDRDGFIWIVTFDHGVFCMRNHKVVRQFDIKFGQAIIQDNESNIWISSMKNGIYKISPYINLHNHFENTFFQNAGITAMYSKPGWGLWLTNGKTIYLLKNKELSALDFRDENTTFNMLFQLKNNRLIAGERGLNLFMFENIKPVRANKKIGFDLFSSNSPAQVERIRNIVFKKLEINRTGNEICSFRSGSLFRLEIGSPFRDVMETLIGEQIFNVFYNLNDDIVINANRNYLFRNDSLSPCSELSRFNNKIIKDHLILNPSTELFNIDGDSIYLYDQHDFFNLTAIFGSPIDLQVRKIFYHAPFLYLATDRNVFRCDNPLNIIKHKPVQLQLVDINFRNIQDIQVSNDSLYLASDDGLTIIPEALILPVITCTPIPYFQSILINDAATDPSATELLLRGNTKVTFNFSCINYSSSPNIYSYRMKSVDTTWTTGTSGNVVFQKLTRGNYVFQLRVRKSGSNWSVPVECRIVVKALFWQHPGFYVILTIMGMGLLVLVVLKRKNDQMKRREIDHQLITLEQKALQSMMNPHFIFNSLGSIQNYLLQKKSVEAGLYLSQFARLIRQNLNAINSANINLEDEVDRLKNYLDLEMLRMENKFKYHIDIDVNLESDEIVIPSMIIQPFVENAIWHGISTLDGTGEITVKFRKRDEKSLKIIIRDNGIGMKKSQEYSSRSEKHFHLGMEMTRRRLELLGKKYSIDASIEFCEVSPGAPNPGTRVVLVVPVGL